MKLDIATIKTGIVNSCAKFWQKTSLFFLVFILINIGLAGLLFWQYFLKAKEAQIPLPPALTINQSALSQFSKTYADKQANFEIALEKEFRNLFNIEEE